MVLAWIPGTVSGQSDSGAPATSDLDAELFRNLGGLPSSQPASTADRSDDEGVDRVPTTDEDVLPTAEANRWLTLRQQMREVQRRLKQADIGSTTTRLQQEIVDELQDLLRQIPEPSTQSAAGAESVARSTDPSGRRPTPLETSGAPTKTSSDLAAKRVSTERLAPQELLQRTWGHLPAPVRERLHSVQPEQFLPEYSRQIEQYFRSVSELDRTTPGSP